MLLPGLVQGSALVSGLAVEGFQSRPRFQVSAVWRGPLWPLQEPSSFPHKSTPHEAAACSHTFASGLDSRRDEGRHFLAFPRAPSCTLSPQEACSSLCVSSCFFGAWGPRNINTSLCAKVSAAALGRQKVKAGASKRGTCQAAQRSFTGTRWRINPARLIALQHGDIGCACACGTVLVATLHVEAPPQPFAVPLVCSSHPSCVQVHKSFESRCLKEAVAVRRRTREVKEGHREAVLEDDLQLLGPQLFPGLLPSDEWVSSPWTPLAARCLQVSASLSWPVHPPAFPRASQPPLPNASTLSLVKVPTVSGTAPAHGAVPLYCSCGFYSALSSLCKGALNASGSPQTWSWSSSGRWGAWLPAGW